MRCRKEQKEEKMITVNGKEVKGQEEQTVADYLERKWLSDEPDRCGVKWRDSSKIQILRDPSERW